MATAKKKTAKKATPRKLEVVTDEPSKPTKEINRVYFHQSVNLRNRWRMSEVHTLNTKAKEHEKLTITLTPRGVKLTHAEFPGQEVLVFDTNIQYALVDPVEEKE